MGIERELKLVAPREVLERLVEAPVIEAHAAGPARAQSLEGAYFDTREETLRRHELALRVRRADGRLIQTLKAGGGSVRGEWESEVEGFAPDLGALKAQLDGSPPDEVLDEVRADDLKPVFATSVQRTSRELVVPDGNGAMAWIELALDLGEVEAGGRRLDLAELELELKAGEPSALFRLALALQAEAPLRLETLSKAARGWMLAEDKPPPYRKAAKLELAPDVQVEGAMAAIFGACLEHFEANVATARDGREIEGVHQLRVALRRLRSAFSTFKAVLPAARIAAFKDEMRWVLESLGRARDLDVFREEMLAPVIGQRPADQGLKGLQAALDAARTQAYGAVREMLDAPRCSRLQLELAAWIAEAAWREGVDEPVLETQKEPLAGFARHLLDQRFKAARKKGRDLRALAPAERHKLRIALKKLRYAAEFFQGLYDRKEAKRAQKTLSTLQDGLGAMNDLRTAETLMEEIAPARPAERGRGRRAGVAAQAHAKGLIVGWHSARLAAGEDAAAGLWREFARGKPFWQS
jgi:triphosphatase